MKIQQNIHPPAYSTPCLFHPPAYSTPLLIPPPLLFPPPCLFHPSCLFHPPAYSTPLLIPPPCLFHPLQLSTNEFNLGNGQFDLPPAYNSNNVQMYNMVLYEKEVVQLWVLSTDNTKSCYMKICKIYLMSR